MKRSICFIINSLKAAGAEKYVLDIASSAAERGIEAHIIALGPIDEEFLRKYDLTNVTITQYTGRKMLSLNTVFTIYRIYRLMRRRRFTLVHLNMRTPDIIGGIAALLSRTRFISTQHDTQPWRYSKRINDVSKKYLHRYIMRYASAIIAPSGSVKQYLRETERIHFDKINIIYHGIELARFRTKFKKPGKTIHIGSLGRFRPEKGQQYIIESLPQLLNHLPNRAVEVHFAGDGPSLDAMRAHARNLGVYKQVKFLGSVYDVPRFLERMDMIVHAAVSGEAFCFAALEGLAAGKAVIATNTDGLPEYITNYHNGILIPIRSSNSITEAIVRLANEPKTYLRICRNAAKSCRPFFSKERMIDQTYQLYADVIGHE